MKTFLTIIILSLSIPSQGQTPKEMQKSLTKLDKAINTRKNFKIAKTAYKLSKNFPSNEQFVLAHTFARIAGYGEPRIQKKWPITYDWLNSELSNLKLDKSWEKPKYKSLFREANNGFYHFVRTLEKEKKYDQMIVLTEHWFKFFDNSSEEFNMHISDKIQTLFFKTALQIKKTDRSISDKMINFLFDTFYKTNYTLKYPQIHQLRHKEFEHCLTKKEKELYDLVMEYRASNGLKKIPLSKSLSYVAHIHCLDQQEFNDNMEIRCNLHSWSNVGPWIGCCYTSDHQEAKCMWIKGMELTNYPSNGYEISYSGGTEAIGALSGWQRSKLHNDVILNLNIWKDYDWEAIGIGFDGGYANIWFGTSEDPEGVCGICEIDK
jgi:hypothetical protein